MLADYGDSVSKNAFSRDMTADLFKVKKSLARAEKDISRRIAKLDAFAGALRNTIGSDNGGAAAAWCGCPEEGTTVYVQALDEALDRLRKARSGGFDCVGALREECEKHHSELLQAILEAPTEQLTEGPIHFNTQVMGSRMKWAREPILTEPSVRSLYVSGGPPLDSVPEQ